MQHKPLIFLGSSQAILIFAETCEENGIAVHGIIDSDYFGNTDSIDGIPVVDTESSFDDPAKAKYYQENFNFFCAVNWMPSRDPIAVRNYNKRKMYLNLIKEKNLSCINIIDSRAKISKTAQLGVGIYIAEFVSIEPKVVVNDFVNIWIGSMIGHHSCVGSNSVIQRSCILQGNVTVEDDVYLSPRVFLFKSDITIKSGSFVHQGIMLCRNTLPGEIVSLLDKNNKKVYPETIVNL
jgi:acetyltransferase-like isoleucine patch superfamily enzyme